MSFKLIIVLYFYSLNFIRFILALGVLLYHYGVNYYPFNNPFVKSVIQNSSFRVSFFFFISGFVMSLVYGSKMNQITPFQFYKKRLSRILPLYWLAFILTVLLVVFINNSSPKGLSIILQLFGLQSWYSGFVLDLNFTSWSISVELFFYLLFPFLARIMFSWSAKKVLLITFLVWITQTIQHVWLTEILSSYSSKQVEEFINAFPLWHLATFFAGMCSFKLISLNFFSNWFKKNAWMFFIAACLILITIIVYPSIINKYSHNGLLVPVFTLVIVSLFFDKTIISKILGNKYLSNLGNLSYGIFIFQYPIWLSFSALASEQQIKSTWFFFVYLSAVLLISKLANVYFEKPILTYLRKEKV